MNRKLFQCLTAIALAVLASCQTDSDPVGPVEGPGSFLPSPLISDGAHGGNPNVLFLPPLVPNPHPDEGDANLALSVAAAIYPCNPDCPATPADGTGPDLGGPASVEDFYYQFDWKTPKNGGGNTYRAFVVAEGLAVGFIDIFLAKGKANAPDDVAVQNAGSNAPIKVMIAEAPALAGISCRIDTSQCQGLIGSGAGGGAFLELEDPDADADEDLTLFIPDGTQFEVDGEPVGNVIFSLETCMEGDELDADLKTVGDCYTIKTLVEGVQVDLDLVFGSAVVSICDAPPQTTIVHFENDEFYEALERVNAVGCAHPVFAPGMEGAEADVGTESHTGGGGRASTFRSQLQGVIPSKIVVGGTWPTDEGGNPEAGEGEPGAAVDPSPTIKVVDALGAGVEGAFVRFEVLGDAGNATVNGTSEVRIETDEDGEADVSWILAAGFDNPHQLMAYAKGMTALDSDVLLPITDDGDDDADNIVMGDATFCASNECADNDIIAESIVFEADAGSCGVDVEECEGTVESGGADKVITLEDPDEDTDDDLTLFIPGGTTFEVDGEPVDDVTFRLTTCTEGEELDADLKTVGDCYTIKTLVDGDEVDLDLFNGSAVVSICDAPAGSTIIHYENDQFYEALERTTTVGCSHVVAAPGFGGPAAQVGTQSHTGGGGRASTFRSQLQAVIPSKIVVGDGYPTDEGGEPESQVGSVGDPVSPSPVIKVIDADDNPVQGAFVRFEVLGEAGNATVDGGASVRVETDANGEADASWVLLDYDNPHQLKAYAKGMTALDSDVLLPITDDGDDEADNILMGDAAFCLDYECADNDIIAESITFQADTEALSDDFETDQGWSLSSSPSNENAWNRLDPSGIQNQAYLDDLVELAALGGGDSSGGFLPAAYGGTHAYWFGGATTTPTPVPETGNYMGTAAAGQLAGSGGTSSEAGGQSGSLTSPAFLVPTPDEGEVVALTFQTWFEIESVDAHLFDLMHVEVRNTDTNLVTSLGVLNPSTDYNGSAVTPFTSGGFNAPPTWVEVEKDLSAFAGEEIEVIFRYDSSDPQYNGFRGWIVDDVQVEVVEEPEATPPLAGATTPGIELRPPPTESSRD